MSLSVIDAAAEDPSRVALVIGDRVLSYGELALLVARAIGGLAALHLPPGARVALTAHGGLPVLVAITAMIELGVPFVPLHPRLTAPEARVIVDDAAPAVVLDEAAVEALMVGPPTIPRCAPHPSDPLAILYTSGTTGRPKGAVLPRSAFVAGASASAANLGVGPDDRWLLAMPLAHAGGLSIWTRQILARRAVVLEPRFDARAASETIRRAKVTMISVVPTMLRALLDEDRDDALASLRFVLLGGAATAPALLDACAARRVRALTTYGLTEACSQVTTQAPRPPEVTRYGSGRPLACTELAIVDDEGRAVPAGREGRIRVRGATMMTGYLHHEPLSGGWFDTGDLGVVDRDGELHVLARRTDLVVTGGENVYPVEVEQALESMVGVARALVFGLPDARWGAIVCAAIVASGPVDEPALASQIDARLAPHKRPRMVCFVSDLPAVTLGKPDRATAPAKLGPLVRRLAR